MTMLAARLREVPPFVAGRYDRVRTAHPVYVLAWLRNGVLLAIAGVALLYLLVTIQASNDIGSAIKTQQAQADAGHAISAVDKSETDLDHTFDFEAVLLTGTGTNYINDISEVTRQVALVAENNGAGDQGTIDIQFAQGLLEDYLRVGLSAVSDEGLGPALGAAGKSYVSADKGTLKMQLGALEDDETTALDEQRDAWPVDPPAFWSALLGPVIIMLILAAATTRLLARHFRRHASRWLWGSLLTVTAVSVVAGFLNLGDERGLSRDPLAGHPVTMAFVLLLLLAAGVMAHLAYRQRLADYRFQSS